MIQWLRVGSMLVVLGVTATGAAILAGGKNSGMKAEASAAPITKPSAARVQVEPSLAERFEQIRAEYRAKQNALLEGAGDR